MSGIGYNEVTEGGTVFSFRVPHFNSCRDKGSIGTSRPISVSSGVWHQTCTLLYKIHNAPSVTFCTGGGFRHGLYGPGPGRMPGEKINKIK